MDAGYRSLFVPWLGGASASPAPRAGYRSLLAPWLGGASAPPVAASGYRSLLAFWLGGASSPTTPHTQSAHSGELRRALVAYYTWADEERKRKAKLEAERPAARRARPVDQPEEERNESIAPVVFAPLARPSIIDLQKVLAEHDQLAIGDAIAASIDHKGDTIRHRRGIEAALIAAILSFFD